MDVYLSQLDEDDGAPSAPGACAFQMQAIPIRERINRKLAAGKPGARGGGGGGAGGSVGTPGGASTPVGRGVRASPHTTTTGGATPGRVAGLSDAAMRLLNSARKTATVGMDSQLRQSYRSATTPSRSAHSTPQRVTAAAAVAVSSHRRSGSAMSTPLSTAKRAAVAVAGAKATGGKRQRSTAAKLNDLSSITDNLLDI
jgi:hypothetical protein